MITKVSLPIVPKTAPAKSMPSFGFAKLNNLGRQSADSFGYQHNKFLNSEMFKRTGFFQRKTFLASQLDKGADFVSICTDYGCSENSKANAEFIVNQILSEKSASSMAKLEEEVRAEGLIKLYNSNYDNPDLDLKHTKALLSMISELIDPNDYVKNVGLLEAGADK